MNKLLTEFIGTFFLVLTIALVEPGSAPAPIIIGAMNNMVTRAISTAATPRRGAWVRRRIMADPSRARGDVV